MDYVVMMTLAMNGLTMLSASASMNWWRYINVVLLLSGC